MPPVIANTKFVKKTVKEIVNAFSDKIPIKLKIPTNVPSLIPKPPNETGINKVIVSNACIQHQSKKLILILKFFEIIQKNAAHIIWAIIPKDKL